MSKPKQRDIRTRVKETQKAAEAALYDINTVQHALAERGYQSLFSHTQGNQNIFIMWINLQSGDELMTVSKRGLRIGDHEFKSTAIYRLVPAIMMGDTIASEAKQRRQAGGGS